MRCAKSILGLAAFGLAGSVTSAQDVMSVSSLVAAGDTIIGVGAMSTVSYVGVTDSGLWSTLVATNFSDTNRDGCLLRNGFVMLREGTALFSPPGSTLNEWLSINMNQAGDLGQILRLETSTGSKDGLFWNLVPIAFKPDIIVSPLLGAGTTWDNFAVVKVNNANMVLTLGEVANPAVTGAREDVLVRYQLDDLGNVLTSEVLATRGMPVEALGGLSVETLGNTEHVVAFNDHGDYITFVSATGTRAVLINMETIVAREGQASSTGAPWAQLTLTKVHINNRGDYLVTGSLPGAGGDPNYLIEKNGQKFAKAGEIIPTISAAPMANGTAAPLYVAETGDVFWNVRFTGANDEAFARNYEPFIQRNRTLIGGNLVTTVVGDENAFSVSGNGRFFAGRVQVQPSRNMVAFADFGLVLEIPGCAGNEGTLKLDSGKALVGGQFKLALDNGQVSGALPILGFSNGPAIPGSECGLSTRYGELLVSPVGMSTPLVLLPWNGTDPRVITLNIPPSPSLVDAVFYAQGAFIDPAQPSPEKYRLTNALRIEFGAP